MATTTSVCMLSHVANLLREDLDLLEAIVRNDDNLTYGNIVSVQVDHETYQTALTDDGIGELRDMLRAARISTEEWQGFLEDFVGDPDIIARVKDMPLR